jgi:phosphoserine phosphatase
MIKLVLFDMDGVIFEGSNFWLELHRHYGTERQGVEFANQFLQSDYSELVRLVAGTLWKGRPAQIMLEMVVERKYQPGIGDLIDFLKQNAIHTAIISSGPYHLAERAQRELGIDVIKANRLRIMNNKIQGEVDVMVPDAEKRRVGQEVMSMLGITPEESAYIGDTDSDVELARSVGLSIAYNTSSQKLLEVCDYVLYPGELDRVAGIIQSANKPNTIISQQH